MRSVAQARTFTQVSWKRAFGQRVSDDEPRARPALERLHAAEDRKEPDQHEQAPVAQIDDAHVAHHHPERLAREPDEDDRVGEQDAERRARLHGLQDVREMVGDPLRDS